MGKQENLNAGLIVPIILAGGKGTRLWPLSRSSRPKQFLTLTGDISLFQQTLKRVSDPARYGKPIVVTNEEYRFVVAEQAQDCGVDLQAVLLEPVARNTMAAITVASLFACRNGGHRLVHVLPSDHEILVDGTYLAALDVARAGAVHEKLVTFGIKPGEPATCFGYVEAAEQEGSGAHKVTRFIEKPDFANAKKMLDSGKYYWNSGMFMFSTATFLGECEALAPEVFSAVSASLELAIKDLDFIRLDPESFARAPDISVDYAVFERTELAAVVPAAIQWSDLGSWEAVWKASKRDANDNLQRGPASLNNTTGSLVVSEKLHIAVDGLDDMMVIASEDAIHVGPLSQAQNVGAVVESLRADPETLHLTQVHKTTYRPWGGYSSVAEGERFQVKRLFVKPGKRLSLQKHHHRSEHWVVVRGTAEVQIDQRVMTLRENESVYIPQGSVHRLCNPGKMVLELIEIQTGSYLGEDDIIRIEDEFGRQ